MGFADQVSFDVRCDWGERGLAALVEDSPAVVIVDVLSFSTCVSVAVSRGAAVLPYRWRNDSAASYAASKGAALAGSRGSGRFSLSPASMSELGPGERVVLPSPNGATLTLAAGRAAVLAGCLRNAGAVAAWLNRVGGPVAVVAAGERWEDESLRPAVEDLLGAGAVIRALAGSRSPEAAAAVAAFEAHRSDLCQALRQSASGRELIERGFAEDLQIAGALDADEAVPRFDRAAAAYSAARRCG